MSSVAARDWINATQAVIVSD